MIQEAYVSFEVAKLFKEKGFDGFSRKLYKPDGRIITVGWNANNEMLENHEVLGCCCVAPTQQMAMRYLREEKGLVIEISFSSKEPFEYVPSFYFVIRKYDDGSFIEQGFSCYTFEKAVDESLFYCLKKLL